MRISSRGPEIRKATNFVRRVLRRAIRKPLGPNFLSEPETVETLKVRLSHLCRLITRDRHPRCPANGILLLVPLGGTDTKQDAEQTIRACREDIDVIRRTMKLDCPVLALLSDMEDLQGFVEFIKRSPPKNLELRIGQRFPALSRLTPPEIKKGSHPIAAYACTSYLRQQIVYPTFQVETNLNRRRRDSLPENDRLFQWLDEMTSRAELLGHILAEVVVPNDNTVLRYIGCYLAATGDGSEHHSGYVAGVLERLQDEQSSVAWTKEATAQDAEFHALARRYFILTGVLSLVLVGLIAWLIYRRF